MRFYSGDHNELMNHHDIALVENPDLPKPPADWQMFGMPVAINHIAISMPNRDAWLKQLAWLRHGVSRSPPGQSRHDPQPLYRRPERVRRQFCTKPWETWGDNIQGALDFAENLPTEGDEAFIATPTTRISARPRRRPRVAAGSVQLPAQGAMMFALSGPSRPPASAASHSNS
jgi:catechol 2,3-dioxygenase